MARLARAKSESGVYHVMIRGINRQNIFQDKEDESVYLNRLTRYKNECGAEVYAYCLMSNHVHILLKEGDIPISELMKKLSVSYSYWFNSKYDRVGHLFQDRFKSEAVDNDAYFLTVFRYIHQNPQTAGLQPFVRTSYWDYAVTSAISDTAFPLSLFSSQDELLEYINQDDEARCMDIEEGHRLKDGSAAELICSSAQVKHCQELQHVDSETRNRIIHQLRASGLSIRQLERLTGINRGLISRM